MLQAMEAAFRKYAVFSGRSDRSAFEGFFLFQTIVGVIGAVIALMLSIGVGLSRIGNQGPDMTLFASLGLLIAILLLYGLASFLPSTALIVRRLHDTNRSGWWFWGWFVAAILLFGVFFTIIVGLTLTKREDAAAGANLLYQFLSLLLAIPMYFILYWLAQPGTGDNNRFGIAPVELEPDAPIDGIQAQVSGFFRGVGRAWSQNWYNFGVKGRMSRSEFWCFQLALILPLIPACVLIVLFLPFPHATTTVTTLVVFLLSLGVLAVLTWLSTVAGIRRLHDADCCGWWYLIYPVPPLGALAWLYLIFKPSTAGDNRFGPQPQPML